MGVVIEKDGSTWFNKFDPKYAACANDLLQHVIDAGYRVDEIRFIFGLASGELDKKISALVLQSQPDPLT